jgi:hypothetical protein
MNLARYRGKTLFTSDAGGEILTGSPRVVPVRFLDPAAIGAHLLNLYPDEVTDILGVSPDDDGAWTGDLVAIAAIGGDGMGPDDDDEAFLEGGFGAIIHDREGDALFPVLSDMWERNDIEGGLDALGLTATAPESDE